VSSGIKAYICLGMDIYIPSPNPNPNSKKLLILTRNYAPGGRDIHPLP